MRRFVQRGDFSGAQPRFGVLGAALFNGLDLALQVQNLFFQQVNILALLYDDIAQIMDLAFLMRDQFFEMGEFFVAHALMVSTGRGR